MCPSFPRQGSFFFFFFIMLAVDSLICTKCPDAVPGISPEPCPSHTNKWCATVKVLVRAHSDRHAADPSRMLQSMGPSQSNSFGRLPQRTKHSRLSRDFQHVSTDEVMKVPAISRNEHERSGCNCCQLLVKALSDSTIVGHYLLGCLNLF